VSDTLQTNDSYEVSNSDTNGGETVRECLIHPECKATTKVNDVPICYECWNKATTEEREWFKKATLMYSRGLLTKEEFDDTLYLISYHNVDPTVPVHL